MKPFAIVIHFDIFEHQVLGFWPGLKAFAMHGFDLEAVVPAFRGGVILTVAFLAHAANQSMFMEQFLVGGRTILAAPVGADNHACWQLSMP